VALRWRWILKYPWIHLKVKNKITKRRVYYLLAVVFLLSFLSPLQEILAKDLWPSPLEFVKCLITGLIQALVLAWALLQRDISKPEKS
jgi:hypothetical protein